MFIPADLIPFYWLIASWAVLLVALVWSFWTLPACICTDSALRIYPAFVVGLLVFWLLKAGVHEGLKVHLLALTAFTLMFRCRLAIIAVLAIHLVFALFGQLDWASVGINTVLIGVVPVLISARIHYWMRHYLPKNVFIYVFLGGFFNGAITIGLTLLITTGVLHLIGAYSWDILSAELLLLTPLMMFPEAFVNGGMLAVLVMFKPQWVATFDEDEYLRD